jgi:putative transposase
VRHGLQQLIELEVAAVLGADRHERSEERVGYRNGYRPRLLTTQVGDIDLQIPKLRTGSFLPSILEPRRRVDQALYAVVMEAYVAGVSTRKVDALVAGLGSQSGISKSQVSRICAEIDLQVQAFLNRPLEGQGYAYLYLDATYLHGRLGRAMQVCSPRLGSLIRTGLVFWGPCRASSFLAVTGPAHQLQRGPLSRVPELRVEPPPASPG